MHLIIGTAGHIDHGKSSLVNALTGVHPDRLPEEKRRGVTIDLGFANLAIDDYTFGIIDVPGHADFVNNMVSGVGALDIALFIVAADDGWMPQSEEHLHILDYLGITNVIIALTKADIAEDIDFTAELVREELEGTTIAGAPIIAVSSHTGSGIEELKACILEHAQQLNHNAQNLLPRLPVDRAFSPAGIGTVVTGTLTGAPLHQGDTVACLPQELSANIRNAQNHNTPQPTVYPGSRTALNIPDIALASRGKKGIQRGSVLTYPDHLSPTDTLDVIVTRHSRPIPGQTATSRAVKNTESLILHHGTSRTRARIVLLSQSTLQADESTYAQLRLDEPIAACTGDRFVLRDGAQQGTLAGGTILDANANRRQFRNAQRADFLKARHEDPTNLRTIILTELQKSPFIRHDKHIINTPFTREHHEKTAQKIAKEKKALQRGQHLIEPTWWGMTLTRAAEIIEAHHRNQPDEPTMPLEQWKQKIQSNGKIPDKLLEQIIIQLERDNFITKANGIASSEHSLELPKRLEPIATTMLNTLKKAELAPPTKNELAEDKDSQQTLTFLLRSGQIIDLDEKNVLHPDAFDQLKDDIISHLKSQPDSTASEIRKATNSTRKVLMPVLEKLDALGITERNDNTRRLQA